MADVKINLEVAHKEFLASIEQTAKSIEALIKASNSLSSSQDSLKKSSDAAAKSARDNADAQSRMSQAMSGAERTARALGNGLAFTAAKYFALFELMKVGFGAVKGTLEAAVSNIDDFNKAAIGTAAAITNIADMSANAGKTYNELFLQNLKATKGTFIELERLAARYFASSVDLQLAYNTFAQRGVVIRKSELEQLAQLTDLILLLTGGQLSTIQIQEEIRSLMNGNLRATSQLSQLIRAFGADVKQVGQDIRVTQSLQPLAGILVGAKAATGEIQKTYQATLNGLETLLRQVGRISGAGFFSALTDSITQFTAFLDRNKEKIGGFAAAVGSLVAAGLQRVEKFVEVFLNTKNVENSVGAYIQLAAVLQTVASVMFRIAEMAVIMLRNLPAAIQTFVDALDIASSSEITRPLKIAEKDVIQRITDLKQRIASNELNKNDLEVAKDQLMNAKALLADIQGKLNPEPTVFDKLVKRSQDFLSGFIPGLKESKGVVGALGKSIEVLTTDLDKLEKIDFTKDTAKNAEAIRKSVQKFKDEIKPLITPSTELTSVGRVPFSAGETELAEQTRMTRQLEEATIRLARAKRQEREQEQAQNIEVDLQAFRRRFALIEQGFTLTGKGLSELKTVSNEVNRFLGQNAEDLAQGITVSYGTLFAGISSAVETLITGKFANLLAQFKIAKDGFEVFKRQAQEAAAELSDAEAAPHETKAAQILERAKADLSRQIEIMTKAVTEAQTKLDEVIAKPLSDPKKQQERLGVAINLLQEAKDKLFTGRQTAIEAFNFEAQNAAIEEQIALVKRLTVEQQLQTRINTEGKKITEDKLRIEQQLLQESGKLAQQVQSNRGQVVGLQQQAAASSPRTELEQNRSQLVVQKAQIDAQLQATFDGLNALTAVLAPLRDAGVEGADETLKFVDAQLQEIAALKDQTDAAYAAARANVELKVAMDAIGNATKASLNGILDAVLGSFEGKKTNFAQLFKGIADNMVRDSMKNVFETLTTSLQKGFKAAFGKLTDMLPEDIGSTLGPAFTAGLGLIASFVLGQLMGDRGGSSTAANPTVGIQSTEQVRGLIGGETQIPIGQIGESLQNALVPTNVLLARIARAVENQVGGMNTDQIDAVVSRMVGDALQIQGV